ncbi:hypothetical protein [Alloyangia pacifica]|uniref:hypothetical protein n=1 Tax=Alloyangia pacifica TaxID=311180 RepID=UPI001CFED6B7|nr:hypothetical protein [Alloyangia pacifica]
MQQIARLPVDTHVHLYPGFSIERCFSSAAHHMAAVTGSRQRGVLCIVENSGLEVFGTLRGAYGDWQVSETLEAVTRKAVHLDGTHLLLVAGRQIVTREGLEVLGIGLRAAPAEGQAAEEVIDAVVAEGALAVLPWGVGKWHGARGACIDRLIEARRGQPGVFLAESGVRPTILPRPARFASAEAQGWRVLAGTDPLPLRRGDIDPGRFGIVLHDVPYTDLSFRGIAERLCGASASPDIYGSLASGPQFLRQQVAMQWRKRWS